MIKFNQQTWQALVASSALVFLTACGFFAKPEPTATPAPSVTLKYVSFNALAGVEDPLLQQFQAEHPTIQIDKRQFRFNSLQDLTSTPPDVMTISPGVMLDQAIAQGLFTDITDIWQQAGFADQYPANLRALSEHDGKQYFLPVGYSWNAIYYNKAVFAQYNLQPPKTWDEFTQICDTLLANGVTPLALSGRNTFAALLWLDYLDMRLNGSDFHKQLETGQVPYDDARLHTVFERWRDMVVKGYFLEDSSNLQSLTSLTAVIRGDNGQLGNQKAAMVLTGPFFLNELPDKFRSELDFFAFPTLDPGVPTSEVVFSIGYSIPAQAPQKQAALTFLTYLGSDKAQALLNQNASAGIYAPASANADQGNLPALTQQGMQLVQSAKTVDTPYFISVGQKVQFAMSEMLRSLLDNSTTSQPFDLDKLLAALETARQVQ